MLIGKKGYYYIKVILFFAFSEKRSFSIREISERLGISEKVLEQVLLALKKAGLATSKRGPNGGYTLLDTTQEMSIVDILDKTNQVIEVMPIERGGGQNPIDNVLSDTMDQMAKDVRVILRCCTIVNLKEKINKEIIDRGFNYII